MKNLDFTGVSAIIFVVFQKGRWRDKERGSHGEKSNHKEACMSKERKRIIIKKHTYGI